MGGDHLFKKSVPAVGLLLVALSTGCARSRPIDASHSCAAAPDEVEAAWHAAWDEIDEAR